MFQGSGNYNYKGIVNEIPNVSADGATGFVMCNRGVVLLKGHSIFIRRDHRSLKGKVKLLSGGGSGHEPGQTGCVGPGMLTASVVGEVFRAPPPTTILVAIRELAVDHPEGLLLIILNYVNNRLNFGLAMDRARKDNLKVRMIIVGDDCAIQSPPASMGRRGLSGLMLYLKVAGAMAEEGRKLEDIYNALRGPCFAEMATLGVAIRSPNVPGGTCSYRILPEEFEIGVGIHGSEPGTLKLSSGTSTTVVVYTMLERMVTAGVAALATPTPEGAVVLINNLGGACKIEAQVFAMEVLKQLEARGVRVRRVIAGCMFSAMDMCGMSITLMSLGGGPLDVIKYLDAETVTTSWPKAITARCVGVITDDEFTLPVTYKGREFEKPSEAQGPRLTYRGSESLHQIIRIAVMAVMAVTETLNMQCCSTRLERTGGKASDSRDAICGTNVKKGAEEILHGLNSGNIDTTRPYAMLRQLCDICEERMSGMAGPLYSLFFACACKPFVNMAEDDVVDGHVWMDALHAGIAGLKRYGRAEQGDRTMLDPLIAAEAAGRNLLDSGETDARDLCAAMAIAAEQASAATEFMPMVVNRLHYEFRPFVDPGAHCVAVWFRGISEAVMLVF